MSQDLFSDSQLFATQESPINGSEEPSNVYEDNEVAENESTETIFSQLSVSDIKYQRKAQNNNTLLNNDLTKETKAKIKKVFYDIQSKTKEAENQKDICSSAKVLIQQISRQDKYYRCGGVNENMTLDAKCISTNTSIALQLVKRIQTDSKLFDAMEFAEKVLSALDPFNRMEEMDANESIRADIDDWVQFGRNYCLFHRIVPTLQYINGSFDSSHEEIQQKQPKPRVRHPKAVLSTQTEATQIDPNTKTTEESTPQEVEHILNTVKKLETRNPSLPFIDIIVNPQSMSETVENIFHSTFLIKDGLARIIADEEDGMPQIASIDNASIDLSQPERGIQSVFSFTTKDWKKWIEKYEIRKPAIRHKNKK